MLAHVIELSKLLPSLTTLLVNVVERELESEEPRAEYEATHANSAWVIGSCAECISARPTTEWKSLVDVSKWTTQVVERWGWSGRALEGLASLVSSR